MKLVVALALGLTFVGCAKEEEKDEVDAPTSLFEASDLEAGNTSEINSESIPWSFSRAAFDLRADAPDDDEDDLSDNDKACRALQNAVTYSADQANAKIDATIDLSACKFFDQEAQGDQEAVTFTYTKAEASQLYWFGCEDDDLEDLDGATSGSVTDDKPHLAFCRAEQEVQVMNNLKVEIEGSTDLEIQGQTYNYKLGMKMIVALQTAEGDPCYASYTEGFWTWDNTCQFVSRAITTVSSFDDNSTSQEGVEEYFSAKFVDIVEAHDPQPWYESGHFDVKLNNWTGSLTFASGEDEPAYELNDGSTTVSGTLGGFGLTDSIRAYAQSVLEKANSQRKLN